MLSLLLLYGMDRHLRLWSLMEMKMKKNGKIRINLANILTIIYINLK